MAFIRTFHALFVLYINCCCHLQQLYVIRANFAHMTLDIDETHGVV